MKISENALHYMFETAGISKERLYTALRIMGKRNLKKEYREEWSEDNPTYCYCYVIAEFLYWYVAPDGAVPYKLKVPGDPGLHRFILWDSKTLIDLAVEQFPDYSLVDYSKAKPSYFLQTGCKGPSKRAKMLADLMGFDVDKWRKPKKNV